MAEAYSGLNNVTNSRLDRSAKLSELERHLQRSVDQQDQSAMDSE